MTLYLHLCGLLFFVFSAHAHKCEHDEHVASNNIKVTVSPQSYLNHPFEMAQQDSADMSRRLQATVSYSTNWAPIRIHVDSSDLSKQNLGSADKAIMDKITKDIIPIATKILSKHLNVIRVNGNVKITPKCDKLINGKPCCATNPSCTWPSNNCAQTKSRIFARVQQVRVRVRARVLLFHFVVSFCCFTLLLHFVV